MSLVLQRQVDTLELEISKLKEQIGQIWARFKDGETRVEPIKIPRFPMLLRRLGYDCPKDMEAGRWLK